MTEGSYSLADIGALMNNRNGWGGGFGYEWIWIIVLFLFWGWNRNGQGDYATTADVAQGLADNRIMGKLDGISNGLCDGFYAQNTTMLQGLNTLGSQIAENRFAAKECCCETNRNIDSVRYENAKNTCDIITNATANTQKILDTLCADRIQALRDCVAEKDQQLQTAQFALSQQAQTANIINNLQPVPKPAYLTCSPYQSAFYAYNGLGNGCGCGYGF